MGYEIDDDRENNSRFARRTPRPDWERFKPITKDEFDNALLTTAQRKFLLSGEDPSKDNRVTRSRIRSRFRHALIDLALLGRHLSPDDFQETISEDNKAPHGFEMEDVEDGLKIMAMFAAESCETKGEVEGMLENALGWAIRRRGDESVYNVDVTTRFDRKDEGWA